MSRSEATDAREEEKSDDHLTPREAADRITDAAKEGMRAIAVAQIARYAFFAFAAFLFAVGLAIAAWAEHTEKMAALNAPVPVAQGTFHGSKTAVREDGVAVMRFDFETTDGVQQTYDVSFGDYIRLDPARLPREGDHFVLERLTAEIPRYTYRLVQ